MNESEIFELADGRIFTGMQAKEMGVCIYTFHV